MVSELLQVVVVAVVIGVGAGLNARLRKVEQSVFNGLSKDVAETKGWLAWLIKDRLNQASAEGRTVPAPIPDIADYDTEEIPPV